MDWENCANKDECVNGNRFGKGCVEDAVQSATGGRPWHECYCGIDSNGNPPNLRQADEIERLREALKDINENMRQADRYFLKESTMAALKGNE
jgi:hypothetical protein